MRHINTISNLAYPLVSFAVLDDPFLVISLWVLGLGSGWYHWTRGRWAQRSDHFGMFLVVCALVLPPVHWAYYVLVAAVSGVLAFRGVHSASQIVALVGALAVATQPSVERAALGMALFGVAYFYWNQEAHDDWWADEGKPFHTIWHVVTAMAFVVLA